MTLATTPRYKKSKNTFALSKTIRIFPLRHPAGMTRAPDSLFPFIEEAAKEVLESGLESPLNVVALAQNGAMVFSRYAQRADKVAGELITAHTPSEGFVQPINVMFVDAKGERAIL